MQSSYRCFSTSSYMTSILIKYHPWVAGTLGSADHTTTLFFAFIYLTPLTSFQRSQLAMWQYAFLMLTPHANFQIGQQQMLIQRSFPRLWPSLHIPHYSNKGVCSCLQVAAKPASLHMCSDSCRQRAYPATSAVVPQVSLPHPHWVFFTLPARTALLLTCHSSQPSIWQQTIMARVQHHCPHPELTHPHFCNWHLPHVLLLTREWLPTVTTGKSSWFERYK